MGTGKNYSIDMCNGPLLKKILFFAVPLALSSVLQLLFNAADLVVVSWFAGDNAMAAVGANSSLINLMVKSFTGLSVGANVVAARERGAGEHGEMRRTVHTAMALSLISGCLLLMLGLVGAEWLLQWMQIPETVLPQATLYLKIYFLGMPATMVYNFGAALLRSVGDTQRSLGYLTFAGVVNVILNLILVIVFQLDVAGVAIATVVSQIISAILVVRCMIREEDEDIRLDLRSMRISRDKLGEILRVGLPNGIQASAFSLSNVLIQSSINSFGEVVIAGHAAANNISGFVHCIDTSLSAAVLSFSSQNLGARKYDRIPRVVFCAGLCAAVAAGGVAILFVNWGQLLLGIYSQTPEVIAVGMTEFSFMITPYVICAVMNLMASALRGVGLSVASMIVSLAGVCSFRVLWVTVVFPMPKYHTLEALLVSYPISWSFTFLILFAIWLVRIRGLQRQSRPAGETHI